MDDVIGNHIGDWIDKCCTLDDDAWCTFRHAYESYEAWAHANKRCVMPDGAFRRHLRRRVPGLGKRHIEIDGRRWVCYTGLSLKWRKELSNV